LVDTLPVFLANRKTLAITLDAATVDANIDDDAVDRWSGHSHNNDCSTDHFFRYSTTRQLLIHS